MKKIKIIAKVEQVIILLDNIEVLIEKKSNDNIADFFSGTHSDMVELIEYIKNM